MKNIILIILTFISLNSYGQDTIKIPQQELKSFFLAIDTLKQQDSIKSILIKDLEVQIKNYTLLTQQDSLIIRYKKQEIFLLKDQINLYDVRLKYVDKWYKKPWVGFVSGFVGALITIHIVDYSLPK